MTEHAFKDTNRHVVEIPDTFAIARWRRDNNRALHPCDRNMSRTAPTSRR